MLAAEVISTDHQLEDVADSASGQLAKHRWHWTLDETNPDRVGVTEYARMVGRSQSTITKMVNGYASWLDDNTSSPARIDDLQEHITRAQMGAESAAAATAVAKARDTSLANAQRGRFHQETRRVRDIARQLAEEHGTSVEEEAPKIAETIVRHEQAEQEEHQEKAQRTDLRVIEAERYVLTAKRAVAKAIKALEHVEIDDEAIDILNDAHSGLKAISALFDARLTGKSGTDWDAELARLA